MIEDLENEVLEARALAFNSPKTDKKGAPAINTAKLEEKIQKSEAMVIIIILTLNFNYYLKFHIISR